jgi:uncharacterized membrane protein YcaP (DUF421 family)
VEQLFKIDVAELFVPKLSLAEVLIRGFLAYAGLTLLLRIIPKRQVSRTSVGDILFVVLVGGIAVEALVKHAESLPDFLLLLLTVMLLSYASDRLAFRYRSFRRLVHEPPTCLIRDGKVLEENLRRELMSEEDLMRQLRRQDVDDPSKVKEAQLEGDGEISVVTRQGDGDTGRPTTAPTEECGGGDDEGADGPPERLASCDPRLTGRLPAEHPNGDGKAGAVPPADEKPPKDASEEPELTAFLAAAEKLQAKLHWHQEQVATFKEALARHGVRLKPPKSSMRTEGSEPGVE